MAAPLDKESCERLKTERSVLAASGVEQNLARGPDWAKANLSPDQIRQIDRLITVIEQFGFRCPQEKRVDADDDDDDDDKKPDGAPKAATKAEAAKATGKPADGAKATKPPAPPATKSPATKAAAVPPAKAPPKPAPARKTPANDAYIPSPAPKAATQ